MTASPGAGGRILPSHRLYSPEGHLLFIADGLQPEATIRSIVDGRISAWKAWKASGVMAEWMH